MANIAYVKDGKVVATHQDYQNIPASAFGDGVTIEPIPGKVPGVGDPAPSVAAAAKK